MQRYSVLSEASVAEKNKSKSHRMMASYLFDMHYRGINYASHTDKHGPASFNNNTF
jgi:hypothetical protein